MQTQTTIEEKTPVNLRIRSSLKHRSKELGINLSKTLEITLEQEIKRREQTAWVSRNTEAIEAYNRHVEQRAPALSRYRSF